MQDDSDTGDARVDEAVARLGRLDELPLEEHVALYEELHDELRRVLSELDGGQDGHDEP
jgi:hypothetical protein